MTRWIIALACFAAIVSAQAPPAAAPAPARGGGGFSQPPPSDWTNHQGWTQIFDGKTLNNWNCDPAVWSVADGAITAKSTPEKPTGTTYCSWMGGEPADFELKVEFRMLVGGNSGIQYRSIPQPARAGGGPGGGGGGGAGRAGGGPPAQAPAAAPATPAAALLPAQPCEMQIPVMYPAPAGRGGGGGGRGPGGAPGAGGAARAGAGGPGRGRSPYDVGGYQYDFDYAGNYPGQLYENGMPANAPEGTSNRGIITYKGQIVHLLPNAGRETIGCVSNGTDLKGAMNINGWNYFHIIARGPVLIHLLNGRLMTLTIDDDPVRRKPSGRVAVQIEGQGEVYFRNIWLRNW